MIPVMNVMEQVDIAMSVRNGGVISEYKIEEESTSSNNSNSNNNYSHNNKCVSGSVCPYLGCQQRVKPAKPGHETACSPLHHLLVMCKRFCTKNPSFDTSLKRFYSLGDIHSTPHCAFDTCSQTPCYKGKWCSQPHFLYWLKHFTMSLDPVQRCKLPGCAYHVFVEVEGDGVSLKVHDFCSWTHCQYQYMSHGLIPLAPRPDNESGYCVELTLNAVIESLKEYVRNKSSQPKGVLVDECFFNKHPEDVLNEPGYQSCWIIVKCNWNKGQRMLRTKDGYHWKQHGKPFKSSISDSEVTGKHLSYTKLGGKKRNLDDSMELRKFHMVEYTLNDVEFKDYCVVKLQKGKFSKQGSKRKCISSRRCMPRLGRNDSIRMMESNSIVLEDSSWWDAYFTISPNI